ncbi:hypothetical protein, partial [Romboutsia sp.]|uniref:hypothetical protein n=1 Tax=Romboutsia sp. TaxID=1965302 RepID=UPI002CA45F52
MSSITSIPSNAKYLRFRTSTTLVQNNLNAKFQVEVGTGAKTYEDPQHHQITILSPCQIEKVSDVADRIVQASDDIWDIEKNICSEVIDDSFVFGLVTSLVNVDVLTINKKSYIRTNPTSTKMYLEGYKTRTSEVVDNVSSIGLVYENNTNIALVIAKGTTLETAKQSVIGKRLFLLYATPQYIPLSDNQQIALRTFANKTNILSLCEIEPTIKCDVPKSVGASVNSINAHLDMVDKDLERVKKLEDATTSTVVDDGVGFTVIEETSNGFLSDIKLEGRTLVNKWKDTFFKAGGTDAIVTDVDYVTFTNPTAYSFTRSAMTFNFEVGKKYTFIVDVIENTHPSFACFLESASGSDQNSSSKTLVKGLNIFALTPTTENTPNIRFACQSANASSISKISRKIVILEGDYTQNPPNGYFEGLANVGDGTNELVVSSCNSNLLNPSTVTNSNANAIVGSGGKFTVKNDVAGTYKHAYIKMQLKANTTYSLQRKFNKKQGADASLGYVDIYSN